MPFILGLTGNIGCGKSTVGTYLADHYGALHVDADRLVHRLYAPRTIETELIAQRFGQHLLQDDETIDRRRLGDIVMGSPQLLAVLNEILRPGIDHEIDSELAACSAEVLVLDAIRLIEAGLHQKCRVVWVVVCDQADQERRLTETRGFTSEQVRMRIQAQNPQVAKLPYADAVIENRSDIEGLYAGVRCAWDRTVAPALARGPNPASG